MKLIFNSVKIEDKENDAYEDLDENNKSEITSNESIRLEEEKDHLKVETLVRDAFWNVYRPGALEHYIVHNLRNDSSFLKNLAYVIEKDNEKSSDNVLIKLYDLSVQSTDTQIAQIAQLAHIMHIAYSVNSYADCVKFHTCGNVGLLFFLAPH